MSGIYIPGMEMPTSCAFCRFCDGLADTQVGTCAFCMVDGKCRDARTNYACPLVHVPEHGEMANADRIRAMTDEELAWWISDVQYIQRDPAEWEMWLKSQVEVDNGT